jgi:hypothetical protein
MPDDGSTGSGAAVDIEDVSMVLVMRVNQGEENESWEDDDEEEVDELNFRAVLMLCYRQKFMC